jgi:hypothetical protein
MDAVDKEALLDAAGRLRRVTCFEMRHMRIGGAMHRDAQRLVVAIGWLAEHLTATGTIWSIRRPTTSQIRRSCPSSASRRSLEGPHQYSGIEPLIQGSTGAGRIENGFAVDVSLSKGPIGWRMSAFKGGGSSAWQSP